MSTGIYIASGKKVTTPAFKEYKLLQVGTENEKGVFSKFNDGSGETIAEKNPFYCELTGLYWLWKNIDLEDYVGLCHYRRFFFLHGKKKRFVIKVENSIDEKELSLSDVPGIMRQYDIILPAAEYSLLTVEELYIQNHRKSDWMMMKAVVKRKYPEYAKALENVSNGHKFHLYNMFITKKDIFLDYMQWLFDILFEVEEQIAIPYNDGYQRRVFGFLAERLLNVYVAHKKLRVREEPIIFIARPNENVVSETKTMRYMGKKYFPMNLSIAKKIKKKIFKKD